MTSLAIPSSAEAVDPNWMTQALRAGGLRTSAKVTSIIPTPIGDAVGLMGEITKFDLTWSAADQGPAAVILKVPSVIDDNRSLGMMFGVYEGEHRVYTELSNKIGLATPRCWFSAGDSATGEYALLIEDLTSHDRIDQMDGADLTSSQACIDSLADLHSHWWNSPELRALPWLPDGFGEPLRIYRDIVAAALPDYEQAHGDILTDEDRAICHRFVDEYDTLIDRSLDSPLTLLHRDYRIDNILFDSGSPVVLDWGSVARGGGLYDAAYFLAGSLTIDDRRLWGDQLLARYAYRLESKGIQIDDFEQRHREAALFCLIVPIMLGGDSLDARNDKGERLAREITRRLFAYLHDYDAVSALD